MQSSDPVFWASGKENWSWLKTGWKYVKTIATDHEDTKDAAMFIFELLMVRGMERLEKEAKLRISSDSFKSVSESGNSAPTQFNHPEIECLDSVWYRYS